MCLPSITESAERWWARFALPTYEFGDLYYDCDWLCH
jgi:hypothetical protein